MLKKQIRYKKRENELKLDKKKRRPGIHERIATEAKIMKSSSKCIQKQL